MARTRIPKTPTRSRTKQGAAASSRRKAQNGDAQGAQGADTATPGVIAALKADNRKTEQLIGAYIGAGDDHAKRREASNKLRDALEAQQRLRDDLFYPACRSALSEHDAGEHDALDRAVVMSGLIGGLLSTLGRNGDDMGHAKAQVLSELIRDRIRAEEAPTNGLFARAEAAGVDTPDLSRRLNDARTQKESPMARYDHDRDRDNRDQSFRDQGMRDPGMRDRDNQGRYLSDRGDQRPGGTLDRYSDGRGYYDHDRSDHRDHGARDYEAGFSNHRNDQGRRTYGDYGQGRGYSEPQSFGRPARFDEREHRDDRGRFTREDDRRFGTSGGNGGYDRYDSDRAYGARGSSAYGRSEYGGFQSGYDQGHPYARGYSGDDNRDYQSGRSLSRDDDMHRGQPDHSRGQRNAEYGPQGTHSPYDRDSVVEQRGHRTSGADDHDYTRRTAGSRSHGQGGWESWR